MQPRTLQICPACGTSSVTRLSKHTWRQIHKKVCPELEEYEYRRAEAQRDAMDSERASFEDALASGRYDP
jgi:hypothetical protein